MSTIVMDGMGPEASISLVVLDGFTIPGALPGTDGANLRFELFEITNGTVVLYWAPEVGVPTTYTVLINETAYQTLAAQTLEVSSLLADTDYRFVIMANFTHPIHSREITYSYSTNDAVTITDMRRLNPFPETP